MDSPESSKPTNTTCETSPAQDSPVFSYISNLSPIQLLKAPSVTPGFPGLNSPPLVFTSPRFNPQSQPKIFKSAQFPRPFIAKFPGQFEDCKNSLTTGKGVENLDIQLRNRLFACGEKGSYTISNVNDLIQSPSGHSEQFLTDIVNVESVDADFSVDSIKKSEHDDQVPDDVSRSKKVPVNNDQVHNSKTIEEIAVVSKQTGQVHRENTPVNLDEAEKDIKEKHWFPDDHIPVTGNEFTLNNDFPHQPDDSLTVIENIGAGQDASFEQSFHLLSRPSEIGVEKEDFVEANKTILTAAVLNEVQGDLKAFQHRGARRRCLQFEDAQHKLISIQLAQNPTDSEKSKSPLTPTNGDHNDVLQFMHHRNSLNSLTKNPMSSGIGLHLNSFVNTVQAGSGAAIYGKAAQDESVLAPLDEVMHESDVSVAADLAALATLVKPPNDPVVLNSKTHQSTTCNKRKSTEISGGLEDITNLEPKNNRMKLLNSSSGDGDGNGCKRCNCKRSKCLKLYCDCFAAGIYCAEPCSCQECFNRPEYEDKVLETRQKIESRDPFAFAPRVVQGIIEQPASNYGEDGARFTPASARHKKGCKCKKSMCLKKYCECYQSNVGCSDVCRCEGCKNVYGQKGGYGITNAVLTGEDTNETTELVNPHTPAVQFSNCGKDASKALLSSGKYIQSPGSSFIYEEHHMTSPGFPQISDDNVMIPETSMDFLDLRSLGQEFLHGNSDGMMNKFSEVRNQSRKIGPSFGLPNLRKWPYTTSKAQSFSANKNDFSGTSLIWRGSPITPMTQFNRNKVLPEAEFGFDLLDIMPDGTPDMLKDTYTPLNTVKVSSPNKKRVSPPHGRPPHQLDSSSSAGIRTGRKFLLRAVPSFPPLTPCIGSKKPDVEQADNPDNRSSNR